MKRKDSVRNGITSVVLGNFQRKLISGEYNCPLEYLYNKAHDPDVKDADQIAAMKTLLSHVMNKAPSEKFIEVVDRTEELTKEEMIQEIQSLISTAHPKNNAKDTTVKAGPLSSNKEIVINASETNVDTEEEVELIKELNVEQSSHEAVKEHSTYRALRKIKEAADNEAFEEYRASQIGFYGDDLYQDELYD